MMKINLWLDSKPIKLKTALIARLESSSGSIESIGKLHDEMVEELVKGKQHSRIYGK